MALNTWGMPATFGAQDKTLRMQAIGELIQKQEYDIYLLEELWMRPDHAHIKSLLPSNYHMTEVMDLNNRHQVASCFITLSNFIFLLSSHFLLKFVRSLMHIYLIALLPLDDQL